MALFQESGGTANDRRNEADRIIQIIYDTAAGCMTEWEEEFVSKYEHTRMEITPKVLFKLRDIKDKYL